MNRTAAIIIILVVIIGAFAYMFAGDKVGLGERNGDKVPEGASGKAAGSTLQDGEYFVRINGINTGPEDSVLTMSHVTYYEGDEARLSARNEVECAASDISVCVATLKDGYYVRESGVPGFSAPVSKEAKIDLVGKDNETVAALQGYLSAGSPKPVFVVDIQNGMIVEIEEKAGNKK